MKTGEIYKIIDSFLAEARDQYGNERSLKQLNQDRHLAVENFMKLFEEYRQEVIEEIEKSIQGMPYKEECSVLKKRILSKLQELKK